MDVVLRVVGVVIVQHMRDVFDIFSWVSNSIERAKAQQSP